MGSTASVPLPAIPPLQSQKSFSKRQVIYESIENDFNISNIKANVKPGAEMLKKMNEILESFFITSMDAHVEMFLDGMVKEDFKNGTSYYFTYIFSIVY